MGAPFVSIDNVQLTWSVADVRMFDGHDLAIRRLSMIPSRKEFAPDSKVVDF